MRQILSQMTHLGPRSRTLFPHLRHCKVHGFHKLSQLYTCPTISVPVHCPPSTNRENSSTLRFVSLRGQYGQQICVEEQMHNIWVLVKRCTCTAHFHCNEISLNFIVFTWLIWINSFARCGVNKWDEKMRGKKFPDPVSCVWTDACVAISIFSPKRVWAWERTRSVCASFATLCWNNVRSAVQCSGVTDKLVTCFVRCTYIKLVSPFTRTCCKRKRTYGTSLGRNAICCIVSLFGI